MKKIFLIQPLILILAGCVSVTVHPPDWDRTVDFSALKTYAWAPGEQQKTGDPRMDNALVDARIRSSVDRVFAGKGYEKTAAGSPDFWVAYHLTLEGKTDVMTIPGNYYSPVMVAANGTIINNNWGVGFLENQTIVDEYEEGTLFVDILDPRRQKLIWRGSVSRILEDARDPGERDRRVFSGVSKLFAKFPPKN